MRIEPSRLTTMGSELGLAGSGSARVELLLAWLWSGELAQACRAAGNADAIAEQLAAGMPPGLDLRGNWNNPARYYPGLRADSYQNALDLCFSGYPPTLEPSEISGRIFVAQTVDDKLARILDLALSVRLHPGDGSIFCDDETKKTFITASWEAGVSSVQSYLHTLFTPLGGLPFDIGYTVDGADYALPLSGLTGASASVALVFLVERLMAQHKEKNLTTPLPPQWEARWREWIRYKAETSTVSWSAEISLSGELKRVGWFYEKREEAFRLGQTLFVGAEEQVEAEARLRDLPGPTETTTPISRLPERKSLLVTDYDSAADVVCSHLQALYFNRHVTDEQQTASDYGIVPLIPSNSAELIKQTEQNEAAENRYGVYQNAIKAGRVLMLMGLYHQAQNYLMKAARVFPTADCFNDLCHCLMLAGKDKAALRYAEQSEAKFGTSPDVLLRVNLWMNRGMALYRLSRHTEAIAVYAEALQFIDTSLLPISRAAKAVLLYRRGLAERALADDIASIPETRRTALEVAAASYRAALLLWSEVSTDEVRPIFRGDLLLEERAKLETARVQTMLGVVCRWLGQDEEAFALLSQAHQVREFTWSNAPDHPDVLDSRLHLANFIVYRRNTDEAAMREAFNDLQSVRSALQVLPAPPLGKLAQTVNALANWHHFRYQAEPTPEDFSSAKTLYEEALGNFRKAYGENHQWVQTVLENLTELFENVGDAEAARKTRKQSERIARNRKKYTPPKAS